MAEGTDRRRSIADRNVTAILDAAEQLIAARAPVTIAGVASAAGVSRVTVYAHFPTAEAVLEAVVERAVGHAGDALAAARPGEGPPAQALERLLSTGWQELGRDADMADAASAMLPAAAMTRFHATAHATVAELLHRGQQDGTFRSDLSGELAGGLLLRADPRLPERGHRRAAGAAGCRTGACFDHQGPYPAQEGRDVSAEGFFRVEGDTLVPAAFATSPWGQVLHGRLIGGLTARAAEQARADVPELACGRLTVDLFRSVPLAPVRVSTAAGSPGPPDRGARRHRRAGRRPGRSGQGRAAAPVRSSRTARSARYPPGARRRRRSWDRHGQCRAAGGPRPGSHGPSAARRRPWRRAVRRNVGQGRPSARHRRAADAAGAPGDGRRHRKPRVALLDRAG